MSPTTHDSTLKGSVAGFGPRSGGNSRVTVSSNESHRSRDMTRRFVSLLVVGLVATSAVADQPFRYPEARHGAGTLRYVHGIPVLTVGGTPEEKIGRAHV